MKKTSFWLLCCASVIGYASDAQREQAYAQQIIDSLVVGEAVRLNTRGAGGQEFLALYSEADGATAKAAILMHGRGAHPNWADVIFPLRATLPEHGWATLSIQLPIAAREADFDTYIALFPEVPARVDAALAFLSRRGYADIVLIAHSFGAMMGAYYLAEHREPAIKGFVAIGLAAPDVPAFSATAALGAIAVPMLDIYGEEDFPNVKNTAWVRADAAGGNPAYRQLEIPNADHFFRNPGTTPVLLEKVQTWLEAR